MLKSCEFSAVQELAREAFFKAISANKVESITVLCDFGVSIDVVDNCQWTGLMYAALHGDNKTVTKILKLGSDPNKINENGSTALMKAAQNGHRTVTETLLGAGACPYLKNKNG